MIINMTIPYWLVKGGKMYMDRTMLLFISKLREISILRMAKVNNISQAQLSRFFGGKKGGYLGEEKIEKISRFLGVDYKTGKLLPGVHRWNSLERWRVPPSSDDMKISEELSRVLFAEGMVYYFVVKERPDPRGCDDPYGLGLKVLVPVAQPDVRVVILCTLMEGKFLWPDADGGMSSRDDLSGSKDSWIYPPDPVFQRMMKDETLTVAELDILLGIKVELGWTWDRLVAVMKVNGMAPAEIAEKIGLT